MFSHTLASLVFCLIVCTETNPDLNSWNQTDSQKIKPRKNQVHLGFARFFRVQSDANLEKSRGLPSLFFPSFQVEAGLSFGGSFHSSGFLGFTIGQFVFADSLNSHHTKMVGF